MVFGSLSEAGLKRITQEKLLLRNISALEKTLSEETDSNRKKQLTAQLKGLKSNLSSVSGVFMDDSAAEEFDRQTLIGKNDLHQNQVNQVENPDVSSIMKLYRVLLERYTELINENERKTVGEIKSMISKDDLTTQSLVNDFKISNYKFENHYFQAAEKAYNYVIENIEFVDVDLNISFWLTPKEIIEEKIGDDEDQAVFLCSLLFALGDEKAEVVIAELEDNAPHAFVITTFKNRFLLLDPTQKKPFREFFGERKDILDSYSYKGSKIKRFLYRFNQENYEQFQD